MMNLNELAIAFGIATAAFIITIKAFPYDSSKDHKIRPLGFVCDVCKGKKDKNGNQLLRCRIKPVILKFIGVYSKSDDNDCIEPDRFMELP